MPVQERHIDRSREVYYETSSFCAALNYLQGDVVFEYSQNYFTSTDYKFTLIAKRR